VEDPLHRLLDAVDGEADGTAGAHPVEEEELLLEEGIDDQELAARRVLAERAPVALLLPRGPDGDRSLEVLEVGPGKLARQLALECLELRLDRLAQVEDLARDVVAPALHDHRVRDARGRADLQA